MPTKGEKTRQRLLDIAMARFERDGFAGTSMRAIATEADVSVGLAYGYFEAKEFIVLAFYEQVARDLASRTIEGHSVGARFGSVMRTNFEMLAHRRRAMSAVIAAMLDPEGPVGVLSPATAELRALTQSTFRQAVEGASGVPPELVEPLVRISWMGHLLLMLAWVQRPGAAEGLVDKVASALEMAQPFLGMPMVAQAVVAAADSMAEFLEPPPSP